MYFNGCAPSVCTYTTITEATRFVYALTLLISLYGGLVLIFRLIVPFVVNTLATLKRRRRNLTINSGILFESVQVITFYLYFIRRIDQELCYQIHENGKTIKFVQR